MITTDVIYEIYSYLPYNDFKHLGLLNKYYQQYVQRTYYKKMLIQKYCSYMIVTNSVNKVFLYHTYIGNVEIIDEFIFRHKNKESSFILLRILIESALVRACHKNYSDIAHKLLQCYPEINIFEYPIHSTSFDNKVNLDLVDSLFKNSTAIVSNQKLTDYFTNICKFGRVDLAISLIQNKIFDPSSYNNVALVNACQYGHLIIVELLLKDSRVITEMNKPGKYIIGNLINICLVNTCAHGHLDVLNRLLQFKESDPSYKDNTALIIACEKGYYYIVKRLMEDERVNSNLNLHYSPLEAACIKGNLQIVDLLLSYDQVDPSFNKNMAIRNAFEINDMRIVKRLLQHPSVLKDNDSIEDSMEC